MRFLASCSSSINLPLSSNHAAHSVSTMGVAEARVDFGRVILYVDCHQARSAQSLTAKRVDLAHR